MAIRPNKKNEIRENNQETIWGGFGMNCNRNEKLGHGVPCPNDIKS
jgi:hypothetical protein